MVGTVQHERPFSNSLTSKTNGETMNTSSQILSEDLSTYLHNLFIVENVATVLSDILAFLAVIRQVWGLWKEKKRSGLEGGKDFVTLLLQQVTQVIIAYITGTYVTTFQNVLSTILICEFTLALRRRNTTAKSLPNQSTLELPDLNLSTQNNPVRSIQSVIGRLQERMIADMGERSDLVGIDGQGQGEPDPETA
ncbi:hypothetical protein Clacol_004663 [Clathrus columnatus]|uniref:Uncharacterized protein n=1 Tax=Clathrus columnatus TaxID=1419009 RepID=A0AAV5AA38_9AGAM|nr:hypothetical protein Clacol_004663 [Clathrus columnatus]